MANDLNVVMLVGRLTRDCEVRTTPNGTSVCKFSVAVNRRRKSGDSWVDEVNYFDITYWRASDGVRPYLTKGRQVAIEGELRQDRWEQDGQTRSKVEIIVNNLQLLSASVGNGQGVSAGMGGSSSASVSQNRSVSQNSSTSYKMHGEQNYGTSSVSFSSENGGQDFQDDYSELSSGPENFEDKSVDDGIPF